MMRLFLIPVLAGLLLFTGQVLAQSQTQKPCAPMDKWIDFLSQRFQESLVIQGLGDNGQSFSIFASKDGLTWTMIMTDRENGSCAVADGHGLRTKDWMAPDEGT